MLERPNYTHKHSETKDELDGTQKTSFATMFKGTTAEISTFERATPTKGNRKRLRTREI